MTEVETANGRVYEHRQSKAVKLWMLVITIVLVALYAETSGAPPAAYNVLLVTDNDLVGTSVKVNGKSQTTVQSGKESGTRGGMAWLRLPSGRHDLELVRDGETIKSQTVEVKNRGYFKIHTGSEG